MTEYEKGFKDGIDEMKDEINKILVSFKKPIDILLDIKNTIQNY